MVGTSSHTPKGYGFDSQLGHIPRLLVPSPVGECWEATNRYFSLTLMFLSLPHFLSLKLIIIIIVVVVIIISSSED